MTPTAVAEARTKIDALRLNSDRRLQQRLLGEPAIAAAADRMRKQGDADAQRRRFLSDSLRVNQRILPELAQTAALCQASLGLTDRKLELYVHDAPRQNASCYDFGDGRLFLLFTSRLIESLTPQQLTFVVGHELAHAAFSHHALPSNALLKEGNLEPPRALALMSWSRRAEISCDRVGLHCCQNLEAAVVALIKLSSGLREPQLRFDLQEFVGQMKDLQSIGQDADDTSDFFSSHPFSPLRAAALAAFWEAHTGALPDEEAERRVETLLQSMEPEEAESRDAGAREAMLWAGLWVASADGKIEESELTALRGLTDAAALERALKELSGAVDKRAALRERLERCGALAKKLPGPERHALTQKLIVIARADGVLDGAEQQALRDVCRVFGVSDHFVDQILSLFE